jgi:hypothetical protein
VKVIYPSLMASAVLALGAAACAPMSTDPLAEKVDPNTGTTVAVASRAMEMVSETGRGVARDPFAYLGPFETNTQGKKALYLWLAAPQDKGALLEPTLYCDDRTLQLPPLGQKLEDLGLSQPPYKKPAPWSAQWFYHLSEEDLECLAEAKRISLVTSRKGNRADVAERFTAQGEPITVVTAFAASR